MNDNDVIAKVTEKASKDVELQRSLARAFASGDAKQLNAAIAKACGESLSDAKASEIVGGKGAFPSVGGQMFFT
jgi:hypothetical protein